MTSVDYKKQEEMEKIPLSLSISAIKTKPLNNAKNIELLYAFKLTNKKSDKRYKSEVCLNYYDKLGLKMFDTSTDDVNIGPGDSKISTGKVWLDKDEWMEVIKINIYACKYSIDTEDERLSNLLELDVKDGIIKNLNENSNQNNSSNGKKNSNEPEIIKNSMIEYMPDQINALLEKKYKKDVGKTILLKSVPIYAIDDSIWSSGGQLAILGDNSFPEWGVTCYLSHNDGERFLNSNFGQGVKVSLKGVIKSYSRRSGLRIDPCNFNTK